MTIEHPQLRSTVVVIGGGIAGMWTAYRLMSRGISTIVVAYGNADRGGLQGSTSRSVGAVNTTAVKRPDFREYLHDLGLGQDHPFAGQAIQTYLESELATFAGLFPLKPLKIGMGLASESGAQCIKALRSLVVELGGQVIDGWVTRLVAGDGYCHGIQYERDNTAGVILCHAIVIASGGYSGLYPSSINTHCYGVLLGRYLACGGRTTNVEFLFRHGYGNIDTNDLTPTEEVAGAEIYNSLHQRELALERLLFEGKGTGTHLQANQLWLKAKEGDYSVDLTHKDLYESFRKLLANPSPTSESVASFESLFPADVVGEALRLLEQGRAPDAAFESFEALKLLRTVNVRKAFRVRPLTYFCMGGAAHIGCRTNLHDVYVTGEFMHDFGANRIGGLPWALYLSAGGAISEQVDKSLSRLEGQPFVEFPVLRTDSQFRAQIITLIRGELLEYQERNFREEKAIASLERLRQTRRSLRNNDMENIGDAECSLLVAEAIMQSSIKRRESRGYFFREDYSMMDDALTEKLSCAWYDKEQDLVRSTLVDASTFSSAEFGPK
jgi:succinate dehydrogenase/fumarate reductase flavoprotein subunit